MSNKLSDFDNEITIDAVNIYSGNNDELTDIDFLKKIFKTKPGVFLLSFTTVRFILGFIKKATTDSIMQNAAQMAYYFLFAMLPMMIFITGIFQLLPIPDDAIAEFIKLIAPEDVSAFLIKFFSKAMSEPQVALLSVGFFLAMWSASTGVNAMLFAINDAYGTIHKEPYIKKKMKCIFIAFGMIVSLIGSVLVLVSGKQIATFLVDKIGISVQHATSGVVISYVTFIAVLFVVFVTLYWIGPARKVKLIYILPGAIFASFTWITSSLIFSYYADHFANYASTYGSVAGIMILMIWFYITGIILTLGGCLNAFFEHTLKMKRESLQK